MNQGIFGSENLTYPRMKILPLFIIAVICCSFNYSQSLDEGDKPAVKTGVYSVCDCESNASSVVPILNLNENGTFSYEFRTKGGEKTMATGKWSSDLNKITFTHIITEEEFPTTWRLDSKFPCLSGKADFTFTRLCHIPSCN
jgi:hypothetical protein